MDTRMEFIAACAAAVGLFAVVGVEPALLLPPAAIALLAGAWSRLHGPDAPLGP